MPLLNGERVIVEIEAFHAGKRRHRIDALLASCAEQLRFIEPRETETRTMHALEEYGVMQVKLYEDIARFGHIATTYA
ncbi:alpha-D-ribose 1-methylphosphonate 5-phosphate C-P-lyase PhnJ, partial [Enterobacter hormaechei subsp. steigerwaltii]|nr:alpha-D-ribose 1-methylphosphonate 5-phosphate C-P-lyase PhnJ [Enterobacter hormaechei subsp. steigerwaltii]